MLLRMLVPDGTAPGRWVALPSVLVLCGIVGMSLHRMDRYQVAALQNLTGACAGRQSALPSGRRPAGRRVCRDSANVVSGLR